ncbi:MAG: DUF6516 family protein [Candidatus Hodarchaeota archaeon]
MLGIEKLKIAKQVLEENLGNRLKSLDFNDLAIRIRVVLQEGNMIYIYFNDHEEYSYSLIFSSSKLDRVRFDNFDKDWDVKTSPHHFHPRNVEEGFDSPMVGEPLDDLKYFCDLINTEVLHDANFRP